MEAVLNNISGLLWGWPMVIILLGTHLFMTFRLKIPQRKLFTAIKLSVTKEDGRKAMSALLPRLPRPWQLRLERVISSGWPQLLRWEALEQFFGAGLQVFSVCQPNTRKVSSALNTV